MSNLNKKPESILDVAINATKNADEVPENISFRNKEGKTIQLTWEQSVSYLQGDFRTAEEGYENAQSEIENAEGMVQGILFSLVEQLYSTNENASDKEILRLFDFGVGKLEELAGISSKESDAGNYSRVYASRKSPIRACIKKVGNPAKMKLDEGELLTSYAYVKHGKSTKVKNELELNHAGQVSKVSKINAKRKKLGQKLMSSKELSKVAHLNGRADSFLDNEIVLLDENIAKVDKASEVIKVAQGRAVK